MLGFFARLELGINTFLLTDLFDRTHILMSSMWGGIGLTGKRPTTPFRVSSQLSDLASCFFPPLHPSRSYYLHQQDDAWLAYCFV
jgi:hypothetical protein